MIQTFDEWMHANCKPAENYSFAQYGRYVEGWRNAMPWAHKGMSVAYDRWAESRWDDLAALPNPKEWAKMAWEMGMQNNYERLERGENLLSAEDAADVVLSIPAIALIAVNTLSKESQP